MKKYYSMKKISKSMFERNTKEVNIKVLLSNDEKSILVKGSGDCRHHVLEDTIILLKKLLGGHDSL